MNMTMDPLVEPMHYWPTTGSTFLCGVDHGFRSSAKSSVTCPDCLAQMQARSDPTKTGPCELKLSFACTGTGYERLDPRDMLKPETSFRTPVITCICCYEMAADHYVKELHS